MYKITNLSIPLLSTISIEEAISKKYHINIKNISINRLIKKSIDARDQNNIKFIYSLFCDIKNYKINQKDKNVSECFDYELKYLNPEKINSKAKVAIIGYGPCGIFATINLVRAGLDVTVIERGKKVEERVKDLEKLFSNHEFNSNSNVGYGEGGAGTFSDGKLNTGVNDPY